MVFGPPDPLWCVKIVHPEFTADDLRKLSEAPRAEGVGVYPANAGTGPGTEIFESITVWNSQCEDYSFEVRWALKIAKMEMNRPVLCRNCDSSTRISASHTDPQRRPTFLALLRLHRLLQLVQKVIVRLQKYWRPMHC